MLKEYIRRNSGKMIAKIRWDECKCLDCLAEPNGVLIPTAIQVPEKIKVGVMIADEIELSDGNKEVRIGWSLCNKGTVKKIDRSKLFDTVVKIYENNTLVSSIEKFNDKQISKESLDELTLYLIHSTQIYFYLKNPPDEFNKTEALDFAYTRLMINSDVENFPHSIKKDLLGFIDRCRRYYQNASIIKWANELH
jgi:hypothetical protein